MKDSMYIRRQQKTSYEGSSAKNRLETKGMHGVPSISMASQNESSSAILDNLMEKILSRDNMLNALKRVETNKGSHGVDGMKVDELRPFLKQNWVSIKASILQGKYKPNAVRRVEIPKPDGGIRLLGIPTVLDRLIQQAIAQTLTNILLDDLDKELEIRGHKFCRYVDGFNIFVKSERAGKRVIESITKFLKKKLKLKINKEKSAVDKPTRRKFLGFTLRRHSMSMEDRIRRLNQITTGSVNYFSIAKAKSIMQNLDKWIRRRLRMCI